MFITLQLCRLEGRAGVARLNKLGHQQVAFLVEPLGRISQADTLALAELSSPSGCTRAGCGPGQAPKFLLVPSGEFLAASLWFWHAGSTSQRQHGRANLQLLHLSLKSPPPGEILLRALRLEGPPETTHDNPVS